MAKDKGVVTVRIVSDFGKGPERNVTLWYDRHHNETTLLGIVLHGDRIVVNQKLVDDLQGLVDLQQGIRQWSCPHCHALNSDFVSLETVECGDCGHTFTWDETLSAHLTRGAEDGKKE